MNPQVKEYTDTHIFTEIFKKTSEDINKLTDAISVFFDYFQSGSIIFEDSKTTIMALKQRNIRIGVLSDVAYGMNRKRALNDIEPLLDLIDLAYTSVDVGYRKPNRKGYQLFLEKWNIKAAKEAMYVGDEQKDIVGANSIGMVSVLINRSEQVKDFAQDISIRNLKDILNYVGL